ncbi:MAG: ATP-dependent 6-phosphofructokinase [Verrucomicrobiota bacterium]
MLKRIGVLTSGGDSPGMNPAIRSITRSAVHREVEVVGIRNGYQGIFDKEFVPLGILEVSGKIRDAGTFLGTSRCKKFRSKEGVQEAIDILHSEKIEALIVIGGDGSLSGARDMHELKYPVMGLPGTIDNDLYGTDMAIGVDTCLNTIISLVDMTKATAASHKRCFVTEVMGRGSGYLALMSTISTGSQVAVIPEYRVNMPSILEAMESRVMRKHNNAVIIIAEGVCSGQEFLDKMDQAGEDRLRLETRLTVLGHVQRGASPTHFDRLLASRMGEMAVLGLLHGESGCMISLVQGKMQIRDFNEILGRKKSLPADAVRLARNIGIEIGEAVET